MGWREQRREQAEHEARHWVVADDKGVPVRATLESVTIKKDFRTPEDHITFLMAGGLEDNAKHKDDDRGIKNILEREIPKHRHRAVLAECARDAQRILNRNRAKIDRYATKLEKSWMY